MSQYKINIIPFQPANDKINCIFSLSNFEGSESVPSSCLPKGVTFDTIADNYFWKKADMSSSLSENVENKIVEVNLKESKRFAKVYFAHIFFNHLTKFNLKYKFNFITAPLFFIPDNSIKYQGFKSFKKFTIRVLSDKLGNAFSLMISFEGFSFLSSKSAKSLGIKTELLTTVLFEDIKLDSFENLNKVEQQSTEKIFPLLNSDLFQALGIDPKPDRASNKYQDYFNQISKFVSDYLQPDKLADEIIINPSLFYEVPLDEIKETSRGSNLLEFGNDGSNFSPYHGMKDNGPFKGPSSDKIKLLFIFHKDDSSLANKLFSYFKKGYKSFPGLYQFVRIPVDIDTKNSIKYTSESNPYKDIVANFTPENLEPEYTYAAIYISRIKKRDPDNDKESQYYKIKEFLLTNSITSQVIFTENIENEYFNFFLPNISIALLAKLDGIPWKLKRPKRKDLIIGIGAYKPKESIERYLGNAFYFKNDGTFHEFDCFEQSNISALSESYKSSILTYIKDFGDPGRVIIHFYKTISSAEVKQIQDVLSKLSLNIPIIIISVNKTESKDIVLFDTSYDGLMPVSGSYLKIGRSEFLLCNNSRYSKLTGSNIEGFPFPVKLRIVSTDNSLLNNAELTKELIDQVYQFSRMYWKSVRQRSLPVTIEYSEIIAEIFSKFKSTSLPEFGKTNLWFL
jgi:hypothetical protein